ncbi:MAG: UDP-3-O-(3-hydroxymyristoyl)glucosamine N-acyltransferase [Bacteroidota bacterium]
MLFPSGTTAQWVATLIGAEVIGDGSAVIGGVNEIHRVQPGDLVFVDHPKYYDKCLKSVAKFIIINSKTVEVPEGKTLLYTAEPFEAYLSIVRHFRPFEHANKMVSDTAIIGEGTVIMPGAFIGHHVSIGANCIIHPNVSVYDYTSIGDNVIIHSGTTIGADAFYYNVKKNRDVWAKKMLSCGRVVIEDDVEIGANCCIDKGVTHHTIIGRGTKMDNLIQIGHDVEIGKNCIIASQVGIAGATTVGDGVTLWGQVGVNKTIHIGDNVVVLGQSGVTASLAAGKTYMGYPAEDASIKRRELVWLKRIPALWKKVMDAK